MARDEARRGRGLEVLLKNNAITIIRNKYRERKARWGGDAAVAVVSN